MSKGPHLVKLVSGNSGSKRITIPKDIVQRLRLNDVDYVAMVCEEKKATIAPAKIVINE